MSARRFLLYFSWSRYLETTSPIEVLENRYPTLFEFRRALYPHFENFADPKIYNQFLEGFLDQVVLSDFEVFRNFIQQETNHLPDILQREHSKGETTYLSNEILQCSENGETGVDTLIIVSLDHIKNEQFAHKEEIAAINRFLERESACLIVCPHHFIGDDESLSVIEHLHHGDVLVPSQQKIGGFARSILEALGVKIENCFGLSPAQNDDGTPTPLLIDSEADELGVLNGVETFNLHPHLPHLEILESNPETKILARQQINLNSPPHPFVKAGNTVFNAMLWVKPNARRKGNVFICDATLWSSAFSGLESLKKLWSNLANLPIN